MVPMLFPIATTRKNFFAAEQNVLDHCETAVSVGSGGEAATMPTLRCKYPRVNNLDAHYGVRQSRERGLRAGVKQRCRGADHVAF